MEKVKEGEILYRRLFCDCPYYWGKEQILDILAQFGQQTSFPFNKKFVLSIKNNNIVLLKEGLFFSPAQLNQ